MVYAAIDIHTRIFQAAVLDSEMDEPVHERLEGCQNSILAELAFDTLQEEWAAG